MTPRPASVRLSYGVGGIIASPFVIGAMILLMTRTIRSMNPSERSWRDAAWSGMTERSRDTTRQRTMERERMAVALL